MRTTQRADVVVSIATYPPRYPTLYLTLKSLLLQEPAPRRIELCVTEEEASLLPPSVVSLFPYGVEIRIAEHNLQSFKKYHPLRAAEPETTIVTADDEVYYWKGWLKQLLAGQEHGRQIVAHRARLIQLDEQGMPLPYRQWPVAPTPTTSHLVFPTGSGGVLYPPGVHHPDVLDIETYRRLCPTNDDIWLYWMARRQGSSLRTLGGNKWLRTWQGTQRNALTTLNVDQGANDPQVASMVKAYGFADLPLPRA